MRIGLFAALGLTLLLASLTPATHALPFDGAAAGAGFQWRGDCQDVAGVAWTHEPGARVTFSAAGPCGTRVAQALTCDGFAAERVGDQYDCYGTTPEGNSAHLQWVTIGFLFRFEETDTHGWIVDSIEGAYV